MRLPFDRFLNLLYFFLTEGAEEKEKAKFDMRLNAPPPSARRKRGSLAGSPWTPEAETRALAGLAAALGGGR